ncbi:MAG TPA: hypothetical protein VMS99_09810, partial [Acidimicrobiia bacterium]|nr:hypothetical protein [Acidimicrobiia bacterium]
MRRISTSKRSLHTGIANQIPETVVIGPSGGGGERIDDTLATYEETLSVILDEIVAAAGDATVVFMQTYNPFSLGFAGVVAFEDASDATVTELNQIAAGVAAARGIQVADAFTP